MKDRVVLVSLTLLAQISLAHSYDVPIRYKVDQRFQECLYDRFQRDDKVTFSVFVAETLLMNGNPKVTINYEGPVAGYEEPKSGNNNENNDGNDTLNPSLGRRIFQSLMNDWPKVKDAEKAHKDPQFRIGLINHKIKVDWTHAGETEDALAARAMLQEANHANYQNFMKKYREEGGDQQTHFPDMMPVHTIPMSSIEPFEQTLTIQAMGWYRLCVQSDSFSPLMVEIDMRSASRLDGVDPDTGHVYTYAKREMLDEKKLLDSLSANNEMEGVDSNTYASEMEERAKIIENQIHENDLHKSKERLKSLMELTTLLLQHQQDHMNRIQSHGKSTRRNHESLVWSSKMETLMYALIMGFQLYTVRKWLLGSSLLGK